MKLLLEHKRAVLYTGWGLALLSGFSELGTKQAWSERGFWKRWAFPLQGWVTPLPAALPVHCIHTGAVGAGGWGLGKAARQ